MRLYVYIFLEKYFSLTSFNIKMISDQRGVRQEVLLIMKRGIEAKSYEGVSPYYIYIISFINDYIYYKLYTYPIFSIVL